MMITICNKTLQFQHNKYKVATNCVVKLVDIVSTVMFYCKLYAIVYNIVMHRIADDDDAKSVKFMLDNLTVLLQLAVH